jgi:ribosomal-protein-serine acetyltransferase
MYKIQIDENITLRRILPEDAETVYHAIDTNRVHLSAFLPFVEITNNSADTLVFIRSLLNEEGKMCNPVYVVEYQSEFCGLAGYTNRNNENKKLELGYWLTEKFLQKGIMTSTVRALVNIAFDVMDMNSIRIKCAVNNEKSKGIPVRLGFKSEGIERQGELFPDGRFVDLEVFSVLAEEWRG